MSSRHLDILTKIIFFYSLFFIVVKLIAMFRMDLTVPFLVLMVPFLILAGLSGKYIRQGSYSMVFVILGAVTILLIRIFEGDLVRWMLRW